MKFSLVLAVLLAIVFAAIGYVYVTHSAQNLPHFFPGYEAGLDRTHLKHAIASFVVAAAFLVYAWFKSAPAPKA